MTSVAEQDRCEIEARRVAEPAFRGHATHEFRAVTLGGSGRYVAERVRYKGPHAVDLRMGEHKAALDELVRRLEAAGWTATGERGQADYSLRFVHPAIGSTPMPARRRQSVRAVVEWYDGLTKHTKRLGILIALGFMAAAGADMVTGRTHLLGEWPSIVSVAAAVVWILAATDDFKMGTQNRIPLRVAGEGTRHPVGWYRAFIVSVVLPNRVAFGWIIPGSMYPIALAYLSGALVAPAAVGALFLLANMFLFLNLRHPRDDFASLGLAQLVVLLAHPGGVPALVRAAALVAG